MDDGTEALELVPVEIADIYLDGFDFRDVASKCTSFVQIRIHPNHVMPMLYQHGAKDGADVTVVTSD